MRNLVIIDVQTLFLACRDEFGTFARVDYVKLKQLFKKNDTDIVDAVAYVLASPYHDDKRFIGFLKKNGYILMRKFAQLDIPRVVNEDEENPIRFKNRSWIESMVWEAIQMLPRYDSIYIVSGNGQFCSVVNAAKKNNKDVTVISFKASLQDQLSKLADHVIYLDKNYIFDSSAFASKVQSV